MLLIVVLIAILVVLICVLRYSIDKRIVYKNLRHKHVVITGGSSGIGKAAAIEAVKLEAHVTIIGRNIERLKATVDELTHYAVGKDQKIQYVALDVTSHYEMIETTLSSLESDVGPIFMLINCAGMCICGQFENMKVEDIKQMIDLNYFGTAYPTKYVLPGMKKRNEGIIVFVSTEAALIGIYGYSAYSAAKWAVRGLAESVSMELVGTGVRLMLAFPPDTDTPGFKNEELSKPRETKLISGAGGLHSPDDVGRKIIRDAMVGRTYSVFNLSGQLMTLLFCGAVESTTQVILQIIFMGLFRAILVGTVLSFNKIVRDCLKERQKIKHSVDDKNE